MTNTLSALHKIAIVQGRCDQRARAYLQGKREAGTTRLEALRALTKVGTVPQNEKRTPRPDGGGRGGLASPPGLPGSPSQMPRRRRGMV